MNVTDVKGLSIRTFEFGDCTRDLLLSFLEYMQNTGHAPSTCNQRLAALKAYLWYVADGDISVQQTALMVSHVPFIKEPEKEKEILSQEASQLFSPHPARQRSVSETRL